MNDNLHQLRCFGCGSRIAGAEAQPDFRCAHCGDLFEVEYPGWSQRGGPRPAESRRAEMAVAGAALLVGGAGPIGSVALPRAVADSGQLWQCGFAARGQYAALSSAARGKGAGNRSALCQAPGHESDGLVQRHGHDRGAERGARAGIRVGGVRVDGEHFGVDGGLCGARRAAQPGADSRRQDCVGQAVAGDGLRRGDLPGEGRLRWLPARADGDREASADLSAEFGESLPAGGAEDAGLRDCRGLRLECARPPDCSRRQPGQQLGAGQGIPRNARAGTGGAAAADLA